VKRVFLTWNDSRRSQSLARELGLTREVWCPNRRGVSRHLLATVQTVAYLVRARPTLVWYQFSFLLGTLLAVYAWLRPRAGVVLVADLHTKALRREGPAWLAPLIRTIKRWALRSCRLTLVTNPQNAEEAQQRYRVVPHVLPDPLPDPPRHLPGDRPASDVVFVCSFAVDEPIDLIATVSRKLAPRWSVAVTGNPEDLSSADRSSLGTVGRLTGFLSESDYWTLLATARAIVAISTEPGCLPCGAYEAIAVGRRPVVALDPVLQGVFGEAAVYSELRAAALCEAIEQAVRSEMDWTLAVMYRDSWMKSWRGVLTRMNDP
jgi:hypothetical protein